MSNPPAHSSRSPASAVDALDVPTGAGGPRRTAAPLLLAFLLPTAMQGFPPGSRHLSAQEVARFYLAGHEVQVSGDLGSFSLDSEVMPLEAGVEVVRLTLTAPAPATPPQLTLSWSLPAHNIYGQWTTAARFDKSLGPDWGMTAVSSMFARHAPVMTLFGSDDANRLTFAASDALNTVITRAGVREENARVYGAIDFFTERQRPVSEVAVEVRFDVRTVDYSEALGGVADWWAGQDGYNPALVPELARLPMYSTWYSYHQAVDAASLLREVEIGKELGYEAIIIDDGWQTLDSQRGYAFTGDWTPERIPDMRGFVDDVHERGMKILLWYAMSLMGERADAYPLFEGKYLRYWDGQGAYVLDPRYPEVREHIIGTYRDAILDWDVDGFKLDFLGFFIATDTTALTVADGRDYASVSQATDRLMTDIMLELRKVKPSVMIEFRQNYIGPLMRKYGNMFRAGDSPNAAVDNRVRTIDLRLLSGNTAVHSDMFMWHYEEPVEKAALQFLNILFSVPQLSVRLEDIPDDHRRMVSHYTAYWRENRETLLEGRLTARSPMANYPLVAARTARKAIVAVYDDMVVTLDASTVPEEIHLVNAKPSSRIVLDSGVPRGAYEVTVFDALGQEVSRGRLDLGDSPVAVDVPPSGLAVLTRANR